MRRHVLLVVLGFCGAVSVLAQVQQPRMLPPGKGRTTQAEEGPKGEQKLRWVCSQLALDEKQKQQVEGSGTGGQGSEKP